MGKRAGVGWSGEENRVIVKEAKFIRELGRKGVKETGRRAYGVGALAGFGGFEAVAVGCGKNFGDVLLSVKGWLLHEADPESGTRNQDICKRGLGSAPGDGRRIEQRMMRCSVVTGKTLADFVGVLKIG